MYLHVTNGDNAANLIRAVVDDDPLLVWRDILHEGPVPEGLTLTELSAVRAAFIAGCGWTPFAEAWSGLRQRDAALAQLDRAQQVLLWFEHDLYDQLQLLQVLDLLSGLPEVAARTTLIQTDRYLAAMSVAELAAARSAQRRLSPAQLELGRRAWGAFRASTPEALAGLGRADLLPLPCLAAALERLLEELPAPVTGLARTERQILEILAQRPLAARHLYRQAQEREPAVFMGDWPFFRWLERLGTARTPLISGVPSEGFALAAAATPALEADLCLTETGRRVLAGEADWARLHPLDRWLGGTHLHRGAVWRWDRDRQSLALDPADGPPPDPAPSPDDDVPTGGGTAARLALAP
jgi:Domain of unknown function (DUF1835)